MENYQRAYLDANSPLTPLTPMLGNIFDFNIEAIVNSNSLAPAVNQAIVSTKSPLSAGLEALGTFIQRGERGYRLGSASPSPSCVAMRGQQIHSGKENTLMSRRQAIMPASHQKRANTERLAIESGESWEVVPRIKIEAPPPRRNQRHHHAPQAQLEDYKDRDDADDVDDNDGVDINIVNLSENAAFVRQQKNQLKKYCRTQCNQNKNKIRRFDATKIRLASPVPPKPLSPRLGAFLANWGMNCLKSVFERQEIDIQTFCCLTDADLDLLGIEDAHKRELVLKGVDFLKKQLQKEHD